MTEFDLIAAAECPMARCHSCGRVEPVDVGHCPRCHASLHLRKPDSLQRTVALDLLQIGARFTPAACCTIYRTGPCRNLQEHRTDCYDLLDQLHTGHDAPGVEKALEAEHWTHAAFYPPVILFDNIVQVGQVRIWTGFSQR